MSNPAAEGSGVNGDTSTARAGLPFLSPEVKLYHLANACLYGAAVLSDETTGKHFDWLLSRWVVSCLWALGRGVLLGSVGFDWVSLVCDDLLHRRARVIDGPCVAVSGGLGRRRCSRSSIPLEKALVYVQELANVGRGSHASPKNVQYAWKFVALFWTICVRRRMTNETSMFFLDSVAGREIVKGVVVQMRYFGLPTLCFRVQRNLVRRLVCALTPWEVGT